MWNVSRRLGAVFGLVAVISIGCSGAEIASTDEDTDVAELTTANLLRNPSFETNTNAWASWGGTLSRVALSGAPSGSYVARVAWASGASYSIDDAPGEVSPLTAGQTYTASAYVRSATSALGKPVSICLREFSSTGAVVKQTFSTALNLSSSFQKISVTAAAVGTGDRLNVYVYQGTATSGDAFFIDDISLVRTFNVPASNLALGKSVTASSSESAQLAAALAVDGDATTRWGSQFSDPQWITVDLGAPTSVDRVVLVWEAAYGKAYQIQTSADGAAWHTVFATTTGIGGAEDIPFQAVSARYVKMIGTQRASQWGYSLYEFQIYGSGGGGSDGGAPKDGGGSDGGAGSSKRPFAASSSWNTAIPSTATYTNLSWPAATGYNYWVNWDSYSPAIHIGKSTDPLVQVSIPNSWGWSAQTIGIRLPIGVSGAAGTDGEVLAIDGTTVHNCWQFKRTSDTTGTCSAYGRADSVTGSGWGSKSPFLSAGIVAAGSSQLAGLLVQSETDAGEIEHALQIALDGSLQKPNPVGEAISSDGSSSTGIAQEGERLAIPPGTPMPSGLSPLGQKVFRAMQKYGVFDIDVAGGTILRAQSNAYDSTVINALRGDVNKLIPLLKSVKF